MEYECDVQMQKVKQKKKKTFLGSSFISEG